MDSLPKLTELHSTKMAGTNKAGTKLANIKYSYWTAWLDYFSMNLMAGFILSRLESHQNAVLFTLFVVT